MLLRLTFLLAVLFSSKNCFAQDWVYAGTSVKGDEYYLRNSSTSEDGYKKVWAKRVAKTITYKKSGKPFTLKNGYCLDLSEYDCEGQRMKLLSIAYYNSKGELVHSYKIQDYLTEWNDVFPDSIGEMLVKKVCELF